MSICKDHVFHERTKYIEVDSHFVRKKVIASLIQPKYVPTKMQLADFFAKALLPGDFQFLLSKMCILNIYKHLEGECREVIP